MSNPRAFRPLVTAQTWHVPPACFGAKWVGAWLAVGSTSGLLAAVQLRLSEKYNSLGDPDWSVHSVASKGLSVTDDDSVDAANWCKRSFERRGGEYLVRFDPCFVLQEGLSHFMVEGGVTEASMAAEVAPLPAPLRALVRTTLCFAIHMSHLCEEDDKEYISLTTRTLHCQVDIEEHVGEARLFATKSDQWLVPEIGKPFPPPSWALGSMVTFHWRPSALTALRWRYCIRSSLNSSTLLVTLWYVSGRRITTTM
eukprot:3876928-Amphidinium_carterae.1